MEEVGEEYFDDLVSRSLFQRSSEDDDKYIVHDLVHDLAAFVYGKFSLRLGDGLKNGTIRTRITYNEYLLCDDLLTSLSTSKHLRTLMDVKEFFERVRVDDLVKEIVLKVRCLRVVSLCLKSSSLHNSVADLKMLRCLNLSGSDMEELPDSICSLFHLQTLILILCHKITQLPTDLPRKLSKLRYLATTGSMLRKMPPKMGSLKELRILAEFVLGEGGGSGCSTLKDLGELHHLGGELCISKLENMDNLEYVEKGNLTGKAEIKELRLRWRPYHEGNMRAAVDVLDALQPHNNLEKLVVCHYPGSSFPKWVGETSFSKMVYVFLNGGRSCVLPPLGQLPSLRELWIEFFEEVEKIGNELLYGNDTSSSFTPFPSLEELCFNHMEWWKEWSFVGKERACFPRLELLHLMRCPEFEFINREDEDQDGRPKMESTKLHHHCPSLSHLYILSCPFA